MNNEDKVIKSIIKKEYKLAYAPKALWHHTEPSTLFEVLKRQWKGGLGINNFYLKHGYPKTIILDLLIILSTILGLLTNYYFLLLPLFYISLKLFISRNMFKYMEKRKWIHLTIFILSSTFAFKLGRLIGILKSKVDYDE